MFEIDLSTIEASVAEKLSKELGDALPDGLVQKTVKEVLAAIGEIFTKTSAGL